jgi:hypothetical protein
VAATMAKKALLDVLEQTIGKYVRNLDAESLNVAVWSGKIELQNLELDVTAVNAELDRQATVSPNLAIPFRVRHGKFRKFQVDVPWAHLMSRSVVLRAQGLEVSIEPHDRSQTHDHLYGTTESEVARMGRIHEQRARSIQLADEFRKKSSALRNLASIDTRSTSSPSSSQQDSSSFSSRLARRIVENIQMEISNVHISLYGDDGSAGVVLEKLQLATTDKDGKRAFVDRTSNSAPGGLEHAFLHKALQISGLGIYLDEVPRALQHLSSIQEEGGELERSYVLAPLSFEATLRQADASMCIEYPRYALHSELSALSVCLSRTQVELLRTISERIRPARDLSRPLFPEYRPLSRVTSENAREWWTYAVRAIGRVTGRRSWMEFFRAFKIRKQYTLLYKSKEHYPDASWLKPLTPNEVVLLERIEQDRSISVEGLMVWRSIADAQFEKERDKRNASKAVAQRSLFYSLFGTPAKAAGLPSDDEPPISLSISEMKEFETATMGNVPDSELSVNSKLCDVKFTLGSFDVNLTSYNRRNLAALEMGRVLTSFDANMDGSFKFDFRLTSLEVFDKVTPKSLFPTILRNQPSSDIASPASDAFTVHLDKSTSGDQTLNVVLNAFEAVASPLLIVEMKRFLSLPPLSASTKPKRQNPILAQSLSGSVDLFYDATEGVVPSKYASAGNEEEESLISARIAGFSLAETKSAWTMDFDLQAPIVVIPENCLDPDANVLVFDLGHLRLHWLKGHETSKQRGSLALSSLTFLAGKAVDWRRLAQKHDALSAINSNEAVIHPLSVSVDIALETSTKDDASNVVLLVEMHAKLSSLDVNWNPQVIKTIAAELERLQERFQSSESYGATLIITSPSHLTESQRVSRATEVDRSKFSGVAIRFSAELERFQLHLNSAQDGLPLFVVSMEGAKVSRISSRDGNNETSLVLDDISICSPCTGRTEATYRTILGLSPGLTESLLTVKYYEGPCASESLPGTNSEDVEAYGEIELSPMRLVYIHSQVLALVEFATEGILGALATQVAATAASAAAEIATASTSRKVFHVRATRLEVLIPQAAYRRTAFSVLSGTLQVQWQVMADTSSSGNLQLSGFELRDPSGRSLQNDPIQMSLDVLLPPEDVGSYHDQAMQVTVVMPKASFIVPKNQYLQLLAMLDENIGEADLFLRDDYTDSVRAAADPLDTIVRAQLTHAGTVLVDRTRRMYIGVEIGTMSLELAFTDVDDPIVRLAAVNASIRLDTFPDEGRSIKSVTLRNLICDDQRIRAITRQHRSLIYQRRQEELHAQEDVFSLVHEKRDDLVSQSVRVSIGSPNVVFIPDVVADVLKYLEGQALAQKDSDPADPNSGSVQVAPVGSRHDTSMANPILLSSLSLSLKTSKCSLIMVDLGSDALFQPRAIERTSQVASVAEAIVFEGRFEAVVVLGSNSDTGILRNFMAQLHGDELECYSAFGRDLESALQILEPTKVSVYISMKSTGDQSNILDIRAATMEPVEVILSMRNVALMSAIFSSISSCFEEDISIDDGATAFLDENEANRIERLASELERDEIDVSTHSQLQSTSSSTSSISASSNRSVPPMSKTFRFTVPSAQLTVINDLQGLDDPLFRVATQNSVANARIRDGQPVKEVVSSFTMFDFNTHVSVLADFFDQTTNSWKSLLTKPWEMSMKGGREPSQRLKSMLRPSTMVDVECFPCCMSFSEQFLMGIASASNMWAVYSFATESARFEAAESTQLRKSLAASAARKFVASLPYAVENRTGIVAEFVIGENEEDRRVCESGSVEYFRFEPPRGRGSAGKREYGQDVSWEKNIKVMIGGESIQIRNVDILAGSPRRSYVLQKEDVVVVGIVREGRTIVGEGQLTGLYCCFSYSLTFYSACTP